MRKDLEIVSFNLSMDAQLISNNIHVYLRGTYAVYCPEMEGKSMPSPKSTNLNLRIAPEVKEALKEAAERDHRSISNMVEYLIRQHCQRNEIEIKKLNKQTT